MTPGFRRFVFIVALLLAGFASVGTAVGQEDGKAVYDATCAACHQAGGIGVPGAFPPLADNPDAADGPYVESVIREGLSGPIEAPGGTFNGEMPAFGQLSDAEVAAVVAYLATLADREVGTTVTTSGQPAATDPDRGERFFRGSTTFANGGPACAACHAIGDGGQFGGPGLGPDLTGVVGRYGGPAGINAVLLSPPFPTMQPLFSDHPLVGGEVADIVSYLEGFEGQQPDRGIDVLVISGVAGLAVLLMLTVIVFRRPRPPYIQKLRSLA
ncbi:c-type cytochrome [bacterium]|nr:c-type cytochrome [bacterium]